MSPTELSKAYEPKKYEDEIYAKWEASGFFDPTCHQPQADNPDNLPKSEIRNLKSEIRSKRKSFSIVMPPPNANGSLHIGHAVFVTLQDIMIRYHRMLGEKTLWLPGADHAGFETQVVYNKKLEKEGRNFWQIPREQLYQEIWDFTQANKKIMERQLRKLGASCDWSWEKFTLDPEIIKIVYATFKRMYDDGLVYRENRLVNWCVKHQTTLSDLEVKHEDRQDALYYINYGPLTVATVRPEPIFADVAVAVNPGDKRYKHLVGKMARIPIINKEIPIIADPLVDPNFGTGAVKITPSVDHNDFELAKKHNLPVISIIDQFGKLTTPAPAKYQGLKVKEARLAVCHDLAELGVLEKVDENYLHAVATCYKCSTILEPRLLPQWYVAMTKATKSITPPAPSYLKRGDRSVVPPPKVRGGEEGLSLRDAAVAAVKKGEVKFIPKRMEKIFMHWMKNLRDWNISRQIVWGIRMPVWYCKKMQNAKCKMQNKGIIIDISEPKQCPYCGSKELEQETDVFDTWFSSGQWPFATLLAERRENAKLKTKNVKLRNNIEITRDFEDFYPTTVMETGHDILFFWVARMIMFGKYVTGKAPFRHVYLHGLVRDKDRQKMSKSRGNVIDPLGVIDVYGTDALRMALVVGNTAGNDIIISEEKIRGYRNFANKIWNVARFVLMNLDSSFVIPSGSAEGGEVEKSHTVQNSKRLERQRVRSLADARDDIVLTVADKKILKELDKIVKKVTDHLNKFEFHHAAETLYHYFWHEFADKIIEAQKQRLANERSPEVSEAKLRRTLQGSASWRRLKEGSLASINLNAGNNQEDRHAAQYVLLRILQTTLKLLHPFMPFLTEAIWQELPKTKKDSLLMISDWPR